MYGEWMRNHWRPMIAVAYIMIVLFDFIFAPIGWTIAQYIGAGLINQQWVPISLSAGGLFHLSMGAILGVSSYTRGQEKLEKIKSEMGVNK